jgi:post-segregation antitoxin (ccd killing protein)
MAYKQSTYAPFGIPSNNQPFSVFNPNGVRPFQPEPVTSYLQYPSYGLFCGDSIAQFKARSEIDRATYFGPTVSKAAHEAVMAELAAEKAKNEKLIAEGKRAIEDLKAYIDEYGMGVMHKIIASTANSTQQE